MFARWPIRRKLWLGVAVLCTIVAILSFSGFQGVYAFRVLTRSIRSRATELPLASELTQSVNELRITISRTRQVPALGQASTIPFVDKQMLGGRFNRDVLALKDALRRYREQLDSVEVGDIRITENRQERDTVQEVESIIARIDELNRAEDWHFASTPFYQLDEELEHLQELTSKLPVYMKERMDRFAEHARTEYRTWIIVSWVTTILAGAMLMMLMRFFHLSIFRPLRVLLHGSRRVASGDFGYRAQVDTHDEISELSGALNAMTSRFQEIRDDLDAQVQQRTKEVVRSEQLASVGFLAAGVAHEINNPLASIAWAAESLESRLHDIIQIDDLKPDDQHNSEIDVLKKYLRRIQDEAFRCKGITEKLLDFSRLGDRQNHETDLSQLVRDVIEMVQHLGTYKNKQIHLQCQNQVLASINPQEIKQVILNLITNALDSIDPGGQVNVDIRSRDGKAVLVVADNGCGMTDEVREHLFEPFFTRRRQGQGTGLGLSITYRIVTDHGGTIEAQSDGPGKGARFQVTLPLTADRTNHERKRTTQAA